MALLFIDSFDHYQTADLLAKWTTVTGGGAAVIPGGGRCGSQALQIGGVASILKGITFGSTTGVFGFAWRADVQINNEIALAWIAGPTGDHLYLRRRLDGSLVISRNNGVAGGQELGVSAVDIIRLAAYYYIEFGFKIDGAGTVEIRVNGSAVLTFAGNTVGLNAGTTPSAVGFLGSGNTTWTFDDVYVVDSIGAAPWNTFLGDVRCEYLRPDGAGAEQLWDVIGAASHWQAVDDSATPDGDTSYIFTASQGLTDVETYQGTGLPSGSIYGVQVNLYARKTDSGARSIAPVVRHAGVDHIGTNQQPSFASYIYGIQLYMLNPGTGLAWTIADVNALEVGVTVTI